ncbi:MAG TPA: glycan-binding surface protein, partial [Ohtaekwangia sp.]
MKLIRHKFLIAIGIVIPCLIMSSALLTSCSEDGDGMHLESPNGAPRVKYIRMADPEKADSLIVAANLGAGIVLMGDNLGGTREVWFNDKKAPALIPTFVTNETVFVSVPSFAPDVVTNKMYIVDANSDTLEYPFIVSIPPPSLVSAKNEWPQEGENLVINGDFFFAPISVTFSGGVEGEVVSVSQTSIEVTVPDGATEGPVTMTTNFGVTESTFHIWDSRNIVLDFDTKVGNGWRIGLREDLDNPLDGKYLVVRGNIAANQRNEGPGAPAESPYAMEYWGGNDAGRSGNFYPYYPNSYKDYVMKFEAKVKNWYGGYLNL